MKTSLWVIAMITVLALTMVSCATKGDLAKIELQEIMTRTKLIKLRRMHRRPRRPRMRPQ